MRVRPLAASRELAHVSAFTRLWERSKRSTDLNSAIQPRRSKLWAQERTFGSSWIPISEEIADPFKSRS